MAQRIADPRIVRPHDLPDEPLQVLYIGQDPSLAELYKLKLELDGYWVTVAPRGLRGLKGALRRLPDLVFLDGGATEQSMLDAFEDVRLDCDLKDIPVVLLWRGAGDPVAVEGLQLGLQDFVVRAMRAPAEDRRSDNTDGSAGWISDVSALEEGGSVPRRQRVPSRTGSGLNRNGHRAELG